MPLTAADPVNSAEDSPPVLDGPAGHPLLAAMYGSIPSLAAPARHISGPSQISTKYILSHNVCVSVTLCHLIIGDAVRLPEDCGRVPGASDTRLGVDPLAQQP